MRAAILILAILLPVGYSPAVIVYCLRAANRLWREGGHHGK